ncbi:MAG: UDP-N-acetylmuramoyl-L-alanine--D-glutamate ligase [Candidatus Pacebacteria bacterium]|nr:UDP-N-acetylmuramoyl-L-alanine--D-glutamate ligase [Candidatus Paceibacterota bacterium]
MKNESPQLKIKKNLKNEKILILGFGKEGTDSYAALRKLFPDKVLGIADKKDLDDFDERTRAVLTKDKNLKKHFGRNYLAQAGEYDLIIKTPGISSAELGKLKAKRAGAPRITSQTEIFFDNFPGLIVGVTGTKGKGTTSSLVYSILKKAGLEVYLGGNIGRPVFQYLLKSKPSHIFVYELSDHQLQNLKKSPQIAVFLNIFLDHQDYYRNFQEYQAAKANIALHQTKNDILVYNSDDPLVKKIAQTDKAQKIVFSLASPLSCFEKTLKKHYTLKGDFNFLNLRAAVRVAELFGVSEKAITETIKVFKGLPHRLEFAGKYKGIEFYDNSMATIPETTILDIRTFNGKPISLVAGGSEKGSEYASLAREISKSSVLNLIVLGQGTGQKIEASLKPLRSPRIFQTNSMKEAVEICYKKTAKNGVCLLSPASASFNMFKDYQDRGEQFKKWIKFYARKKIP